MDMNNKQHRAFIFSTLALIIASAIHPVQAEDEFDLEALEFNSPLENTDTLRNFVKNNAQLPGTYRSHIVVDNVTLETRDVTYVLSENKKQLLPVFTKADLRQFGLKVDTIPGLKMLSDDAQAEDLQKYVPQAGYSFDVSTQTLAIRVPQIYRNMRMGDIADSSRWDDGVPAAWLNYYYSGSQQHTDYGEDTSHYVNLNSGINLGPWRLRNNSIYSNTDGWDSANTWLQRDIAALKSQLAIGETWTDGELFDSIQFTGVKLGTNTNMLSNREQGFAPTITGIANSDAKVTIKQNGYVIYETYVSPGPFEINDLNQTSAGSEFEVTITEADGSQRSYIQNSAAVPILVRQGTLKYNLAAGRYRANDGYQSEEPDFAQGTLVYGLPLGMTAYGGALGSDKYQSALLGLGVDLRAFGGISADVTGARAKEVQGNADKEGLSWRAQYAKNFSETDTSLTLASYRYSTSGFYTFEEAINAWNDNNYDDDDLFGYRNRYNRRSRQQININQSIGDWGSIYVNAGQQDYWHLKGKERSINVGYSRSFDYFFMSMSYGQTETPWQDSDKQVALSISVPLDRWLAGANASYSMSHSDSSGAYHSAGLSGVALERDNLSYSLTQTYDDRNNEYGGSLTSQYRGSLGQVGVGYNYTPNSHQINYNAQGGLLVHPYGVTLAQSINNTTALVHTEGASGVELQNSQGVSTDAFGNAVVPWLTEYRANRIVLNTQSAPDVDIPEAVQEVVPTSGAVVVANFKSHVGARALVTLRHNGKVVPYGAMVSTDKGMSSLVADDGEVYLTGLQGSNVILAKWGDSAAAQCKATVNTPEARQESVLKIQAVCQ